MNIIWELKKRGGDSIRVFENLADEGVRFFKEIYA